jgi:hypothetical protein
LPDIACLQVKRLLARRSGAGIVYRAGTKILLVGPSGVPKLLWTARGRPIGLSIVGRRVAWAESVKGHGRIVALTIR